MRLIVLYSIASLLIISCGSESDATTEENQLPTQEVTKEEDVSIETTTYSAEVFEKGPADWGYRILNNGSLYINQPHIPSMPGNKGFSSEEKASITANYVLSKLESGIALPTLSAAELDSLGVLN